MHPHEKTRITHADIVARGWEAVARGDWEALTADYVEDMIFVMPGQTDVLTGKPAFRVEIQAIRQIGEMGEVVSVVAWSCTRHQLAVLFRFEGDKIAGERWFVDTEPWHSAF
jgi:ketosteroid isomerase-like protein